MELVQIYLKFLNKITIITNFLASFLLLFLNFSLLDPGPQPFVSYLIVEVLSNPLQLDDLLVDHVQVHDDVVLIHKRLLGLRFLLINRKTTLHCRHC